MCPPLSLVLLLSEMLTLRREIYLLVEGLRFVGRPTPRIRSRASAGGPALRFKARASAKGPAEHLGRLASCPPSAVFALLLSGGFCTQPPPFTYAIRPKYSAGLVVIRGFLS